MSRIRGAALIGLVAVLAVYAAAAVSAQRMGMRMGMRMGGPSPEHLGRMLFFDTNLSASGNQSCSSCHDASTGFTGPQSTINALDVVYEGSIAGRFGNRKPQSAAYAMLAPRFDYDADRGFSGGNFWDGRATGWQLGSAVADQAQAPFLNPLEHGLADPAEVVARVCAAHYGRMLRRVWGASVCSDVDLGFAAIAQSLAAFESSVAVSPFSSKYDAVLSGQAELTAREQQGLELFEGKARCASCHNGEPTSRDKISRSATSATTTSACLGTRRTPSTEWIAWRSTARSSTRKVRLGSTRGSPGSSCSSRATTHGAARRMSPPP